MFLLCFLFVCSTIALKEIRVTENHKEDRSLCVSQAIDYNGCKKDLPDTGDKGVYILRTIFKTIPYSSKNRNVIPRYNIRIWTL